TTYTASGNKGNALPPAGSSSSLCLSCHDGTIAPGTTVAYGTFSTSAKMQDVFGSNMQSTHPFSMLLPLRDAPHLVSTLTTTGQTADVTGAVKLISGNVECTSCHNPHQQSIDRTVPAFLVRDSSGGQLCLSCHDPNRITSNQTNPLAQWPTSIHATAPNATTNQPSVGGYNTVAQNACSACHAEHNGSGLTELLRGANEQDCISCHNGGTNVTPAAPNVFAEFSKAGALPGTAHPFPSGTNTHDASEPALLNQNRHATCADCHNPHASRQVATFPVPPAIRASQNLVSGINATDGITVLNPAVNQYENCLRCHGTSTGKVASISYGYQPTRMSVGGDPLNVSLQLNSGTYPPSSHPVMHTRNSPYSQPSLLTNMLKIDGVSLGRAMGTQILCTDCHNSDDNREFGGVGSNGPHGSAFSHILERRYEFSQAPAPGQQVTNLFPSPDLSAKGPYGLCAKCHNMTNIVSDASFNQHSRHINRGFSCSACHAAHGTGGQSSWERLVSFDLNVVAPSVQGQTPLPITYSKATNSCTLTCHNHKH
ncbi:MAG TPA: cytochrome c3 family protein, partial [Candidatus Limnocylindrales bacterium]|nr:cytochrome c3 family protein [Candidatus Limnocylindrales bacterium]